MFNGNSAYCNSNSYDCGGERDPFLAPVWTWVLSRVRDPGDLARV